jgi:hypothetical protein
MQRDFTNRGLGIRVFDNECVVIEKKGGVHGWVEDGQRHSLPVPDNFDSITTNPASRLALAFRYCEMENPAGELRALLTQKPAAAKGE